MNNLQIFTFAGTAKVRTILEDDGIKFVAADVCNALGLGNTSQATSNLDEDEKGISIADTLGGKQTMVSVTESGLYTLILRSRKPEAKAFRRWVTGEVLPSLRRTGTFTVLPDPPKPAYELPKTFSEALRLLADTHDLLPKTFSEALRLLADTHDQAESLKHQIEAQRPAVAFVEHYVQAEGSFGLRETAKLLGMAPRRFTECLRLQRILFREGGHLQPYAEHLSAGYFTLRTGEDNDHAWVQTRVTPKGVEWLRRRLQPAQHTTLAQSAA